MSCKPILVVLARWNSTKSISGSSILKSFTTYQKRTTCICRSMDLLVSLSEVKSEFCLTWRQLIKILSSCWTSWRKELNRYRLESVLSSQRYREVYLVLNYSISKFLCWASAEKEPIDWETVAFAERLIFLLNNNMIDKLAAI